MSINNDETEDKNGWVTIDLDTLDDYKEPKFEDENDLEEDELPAKKTAKVVDEDDELEEDETEEDPKEEVRKSRAQDRIQQLVTKEKAAKAELELARQKIRELEEGMTSKTRTAAETQKTLIDNQISVVKDSLRRAKEDGDVDKELDLQEKLSNLQVDKRIVEAQVSKIPAKTEAKAAEVEHTLPEEMKYWLEDNAWALKPSSDEDRRKIRAIRKISSDLTNEGYLDSEADFYSELDDRLKKVFASKGVDGVEYKSKDTESSSRDVKQRKSPVSTSSRVPVSRRNRVSLSPSESQIADKLNMDPKRYAARKQAKEESNGDWTIIN